MWDTCTGAVYWGPCHQAVEEACKEAETFEVFSYNYDLGLPALREALRKKIREKNGLDGVAIFPLLPPGPPLYSYDDNVFSFPRLKWPVDPL